MNEQTRKETKSLLLEKCSLDFKMSDTCVRPIDYEVMPRHFGETRKILYSALVEDINKFYNRIFGWIKANPSEPGLAEAIKSVFLWCNEDKVSTPARVVNVKTGHNCHLFFCNRFFLILSN